MAALPSPRGAKAHVKQFSAPRSMPMVSALRPDGSAAFEGGAVAGPIHAVIYATGYK